jgi:hypothetical protein
LIWVERGLRIPDILQTPHVHPFAWGPHRPGNLSPKNAVPTQVNFAAQRVPRMGNLLLQLIDRTADSAIAPPDLFD